MYSWRHLNPCSPPTWPPAPLLIPEHAPSHSKDVVPLAPAEERTPPCSPRLPFFILGKSIEDLGLELGLIELYSLLFLLLPAVFCHRSTWLTWGWGQGEQASHPERSAGWLGDGWPMEMVGMVQA